MPAAFCYFIIEQHKTGNASDHLANSQHISGFGIGLYLSAEIIREHGGKIWVESESGKGSTFFFSLPFTDQRRGKYSPIRLP
ncbi:hypothetical protein D0C36_16195 [Mucilaginibacter conchicola]|uniref:histidine kinase n=1 Tax=Mucilaginibacter conchicola TaxID=2303333 RepID=A0A372NUK2_9SPHI|nr:ATP-binding protein [Mucilaginibacter conchicola]RFZ92928.1 hypothetical protein D0C36_16195 [Mucilaginibacter conchicola]